MDSMENYDIIDKDNKFKEKYSENTEEFILNQSFLFYKRNFLNKENFNFKDEEKLYFKMFNKSNKNYNLSKYIYFSNNKKNFKYTNYLKLKLDFNKNELIDSLNIQNKSILDESPIKESLFNKYFYNKESYLGFYSRSIDYLNFKLNILNQTK